MTKYKLIDSRKVVSGSALALTMLTIAALITLSLGMATVVPRDYRDSLAFEASLTAETNAWSGVEQGLYAIKLKKQSNQFYELSNEMKLNPSNYPRGVYNEASVGANNCYNDRTVCPALDRALGMPQNQTPYQFGDVSKNPGNDVLSSLGSSFSLLVWHERDTVGNPHTLFDNISPANDRASNSANINSVLQRDEVRRLDARRLTAGHIDWVTVHDPTNGCNVVNSGTDTYLVLTYLNDQNDVIDRKITKGTNTVVNSAVGDTYPIQNIGGATVLSLRYLVTNADQTKITNCYARYRIINNLPTDSADLGYDVVESTGKSGSYQRKLRVQVDRENGRPLNIFDFGLVCQECTNIQ